MGIGAWGAPTEPFAWPAIRESAELVVKAGRFGFRLGGRADLHTMFRSCLGGPGGLVLGGCADMAVTGVGLAALGIFALLRSCSVVWLHLVLLLLSDLWCLCGSVVVVGHMSSCCRWGVG